MNEQQLRQALVDVGKKLVEYNLVQGTWGNISVRLDDKYMLITPSGLDYAYISPDVMVKVEIATLSYEGNVKPSSERKIHAAVYAKRSDVNAIIHTHSLYASVLACANKPLITKGQARVSFNGDVAVSRYALPSTGALTKATVEGLGNANACIMANHGMICCGGSLDNALELCNYFEQQAMLAVEGGTENHN